MTNRIDDIKRALLPVFEKYRDKGVFAYLFGSVAVGESAPLSAVDVAVYFEWRKGNTFFERPLTSAENDLLS